MHEDAASKIIRLIQEASRPSEEPLGEPSAIHITGPGYAITASGSPQIHIHIHTAEPRYTAPSQPE